MCFALLRTVLRGSFLIFLALGSVAGTRMPAAAEASSDIVAEAFEAAQRALLSSAGRALRQLGFRENQRLMCGHETGQEASRRERRRFIATYLDALYDVQAATGR